MDESGREAERGDAARPPMLHLEVDAGGRIVVPEPLRSFLRIGGGVALAFESHQGSLEFRLQLAPEAIERARLLILPDDEPTLTDEELDSAVEQASEAVYQRHYGPR